MHLAKMIDLMDNLRMILIPMFIHFDINHFSRSFSFGYMYLDNIHHFWITFSYTKDSQLVNKRFKLGQATYLHHIISKFHSLSQNQ